MKKTLKLGQLVDIRTGYPTRNSVKKAPAGDVCLLQLRDFDKTRTTIHPDDILRFNPVNLRNDQLIAADDVLFLAKGTGNFAFQPGNLSSPTVAASCFFVLKPSREVLPQYLVWFLNHPKTVAEFERLAGVGARVPVIRKSELADLPVPLPSLEKQEAIVRLTALAAGEARLLEELRQKRQTFIDAATMLIAEDR